MTVSKKLRQQVYEKYHGLCAYTGLPLEQDWQVDHVTPHYYFKFSGQNPNTIENLLPALKIINHYKREQDLEQFRQYIKTLHIRLKKLPKKTVVERTKGRIIYLNKVAELFGITVDKPFSGVFYFETIPALTNSKGSLNKAA